MELYKNVIIDPKDEPTDEELVEIEGNLEDMFSDDEEDEENEGQNEEDEEEEGANPNANQNDDEIEFIGEGEYV